MQNYNQPKSNKLYIYIAIGVILAITISNTWFWHFIRRLLRATLPILAAFLIAFFVEPLVIKIKNRFYSQKPRGHFKAVLTSYLLIILAIFLFFRLFSKPLLYDIKSFVETVSSRSFIVSLSQKIDATFNVKSFQYLSNGILDIQTWLTANFGGIVISTFNKTVSYFLNALFIIAAAIYMSVDYTKFQKLLNKKIKSKSSKVIETLDEINLGMKAWSKGWLKDQAFIFFWTFVFLWLLGIESFFTLTVIMTLFNFVPFFGPIIGGLIIWIYIFTTYVSVSGSWAFFGLIFIPSNVVIILALIAIGVIQTVESLWWVPKVYAKEIDINPLTVLLSLSVIATLISPLFTPLTIPAIVIGRVVYKNYFAKYLE